MKTSLTQLALALTLAVTSPCLWAVPFTYQGQLSYNGSPATNTYDFEFVLYDAASNGNIVGTTQTVDDVPVTNGIFQVELDFGNTFDGDDYWLEVHVRPGSSVGSYTPLSPRQYLSFTPNAQYAIAASDGPFWKLGGNTGVGSFLGTIDNSALEFRVNGKRVGLITDAVDSSSNHAPNVLLGGENNVITSGVYGATIGGGGGKPTNTSCGDGNQPCVNTVTNHLGTVSGGEGNYASGYASTVGGGYFNTASDASSTVGGGYANIASRTYSTIGGGATNTASGFYATVGGGFTNTASSDRSTVAGGYANTASGSFATVGGGSSNTASGANGTVGGGSSNTASGSYATVGGGSSNIASDNYATVGGGLANTASGEAAMVPGGRENQAGGSYSFAAGRRAKVRDAATVGEGDTDGDEGTFVWADSTAADFVSTGPDQFLVRASGGIWFGTTSSPSISAGQFIATSTGAYLADGGTWTNSSDRNRKTNFQPIDPQAVLEKVVSLPILRWNYKEEDENTLHLGPMAQDFHAAFGLGADDKHIATVDADGVALAAIQALAKENLTLKVRLGQLEADRETRQQQLAQLQQALEALQANQQQLLSRLLEAEGDENTREPAQ